MRDVRCVCSSFLHQLGLVAAGQYWRDARLGTTGMEAVTCLAGTRRLVLGGHIAAMALTAILDVWNCNIRTQL